MGDAADDLRDIEEALELEGALHAYNRCDPYFCPICSIIADGDVCLEDDE